MPQQTDPLGILPKNDPLRIMGNPSTPQKIWIDTNDPKRSFIKKPDETGEFENISLDEATKTQLQRAISTIARQATMGAKKEVFNPE